MKHPLRPWAGAVFGHAIACAALTCSADVLSIAVAASATVAERVDARVQQVMARQRIPGLSIAVVRGGKVILAKGYGLANVELDVAVTPRTVFQIQSITKTFTAAAILMLVEEGRLALDDTIGKHLDGSPPSWDSITLRHLLSHTSGIPDYINRPTTSLRLDASDEEVLKSVAARPLDFVPGAKYSYSNTNYHLLAMVIRKATGKDYGAFLQERVFDPLGMNDTRVVSLAEILPRRASGYLRLGDRLRNGEYIAPSILGYGGGGLRSTVLDLARWDAALDGDRLLANTTRQRMYTPARLNDGSSSTYALGWAIHQVRGHRCLAHTGMHSTGFASAICRFVDDRLTVIALTNLRSADALGIACHVAGFYEPGLARPEYSPIEDREPEVAARVRMLLDDLAQGKAEHEHFSAELWKKLSSEQRQIQEAARELGALESITLVERKEENGLRVYRYRVVHRYRVRLVLATFSADGKLAGLFWEDD